MKLAGRCETGDLSTLSVSAIRSDDKTAATIANLTEYVQIHALLGSIQSCAWSAGWEDTSCRGHYSSWQKGQEYLHVPSSSCQEETEALLRSAERRVPLLQRHSGCECTVNQAFCLHADISEEVEHHRSQRADGDVGSWLITARHVSRYRKWHIVEMLLPLPVVCCSFRSTRLMWKSCRAGIASFWEIPPQRYRLYNSPRKRRRWF